METSVVDRTVLLGCVAKEVRSGMTIARLYNDAIVAANGNGVMSVVVLTELNKWSSEPDSPIEKDGDKIAYRLKVTVATVEEEPLLEEFELDDKIEPDPRGNEEGPVVEPNKLGGSDGELGDNKPSAEPLAKEDPRRVWMGRIAKMHTDPDFIQSLILPPEKLEKKDLDGLARYLKWGNGLLDLVTALRKEPKHPLFDQQRQVEKDLAREKEGHAATKELLRVANEQLLGFGTIEADLTTAQETIRSFPQQLLDCEAQFTKAKDSSLPEDSATSAKSRWRWSALQVVACFSFAICASLCWYYRAEVALGASKAWAFIAPDTEESSLRRVLEERNASKQGSSENEGELE